MSKILYQHSSLVIDEDVIKAINENTKETTSYLISKVNSTNITTKDFEDTKYNPLGIIFISLAIPFIVGVGIASYEFLEPGWVVKLVLLACVVSTVLCIVVPPYNNIPYKRYYLHITQSSGELIQIFYSRHKNVIDEIETTILHMLHK